MKAWLAKIFGKAAADRLRLPEMLVMRGARPPRAIGADGELAIQRCQHCSSKELCDAYLKAGYPDAYRGFCPNAAYVESLRDKSRSLS